VQLHDEVPIDAQLLILGAAMTAGGPKHLLIPPARRFNIRDGDHRLRPHGRDSLVGHGLRLGVAPRPGLDESDVRTGYQLPGADAPDPPICSAGGLSAAIGRGAQIGSLCVPSSTACRRLPDLQRLPGEMAAWLPNRSCRGDEAVAEA
jgi:hypothetical protein